MRLSKVRIKNFKSIKDSGDIVLDSNMFVLAGQNESGKSSILEALDQFTTESGDRTTLNFELENNDNLEQEIICEFTGMNEDFYSMLSNQISLNYLSDHHVNEHELENMVVDRGTLKKINSISISKKFDYSKTKFSITREINSGIKILIINSIKFDEQKLSSSLNNEDLIEPVSGVNIDQFMQNVIDEILHLTPKIILYNDFSTLLPDKILLTEIKQKSAEGYKAVNNLENLLKTDFSKIASKKTPQKNSTAENESGDLSAMFQEDWQQKIFGTNLVKIKFIIENNTGGQPEISFYIETKDSEFLAPRERSKGMRWFLSLWLELKAREKEENLIFLFDEPGLHLHIKANKDMLMVFHKLVTKGHQIIYSTHSPSLIETDYLNNIGLVLNDKKKGTLVEKLTTCKIDTTNKRDALQPIAQAMGIDLDCNFSVLHKKNVLVEGISDFWYFKGFAHLLNLDRDYEFVPGIGVNANKIYNIISFCIGYGLDWLLIMDGGTIPKKNFKNLQLKLFNNDEEKTNDKIKMLDGEIEDMFTLEDLKGIDPTITINKNKSSFENIGKNRKVICAKLFYQKVSNDEIKKEHLNSKTIERFKNVFDWIEENFKDYSSIEE